MANLLSNIILPDATSVILKDNSQSKSDHRHDSTNIVPIVHKLYESTSYYATAANQGASTWYVASVKPDSWYLPWKIRFKFHTYCPNYPAYESVTYSMITGRSTGISYANWNEIQTTGHYYINVQPLTAAGFNAGYGFAIGVCIYAATDYTKAAYYRSFEVDFLESENCTVTVLDTPVKWADWPGTGTTNYGSLVSTNAATRGLQETGDNNDVLHSRIVYFSGKTGTKGIWAASIFMEDGNGTFQNVATASDGTVTTANRTASTTKKANTNGFKVGSSIWYPNTSYNANTNISGSSVVYSAYGLVDTRYVFNTTLTANCLTPYKLIYLVGEINPVDNLFYLDQDVWWTQTPDDTTKVYVLVGGVYDSTTSNCRMQLYEQNKWYRYDGTNLVEFIYGATTLVSKGSTIPVTNNAPYLFRQSGGDNNADVYNQETDKLVGASVVVNQLLQNGNFASTINWITNNSTLSVDNNIGQFIVSAANGNIATTISFNAHKYLFMCDIKTTTPTTLIKLQARFDTLVTIASTTSTTNWQTLQGVVNGAVYDGYVRIIDQRTENFDKIQVKNVMVIDLTAMFGTAIADYVYSLENATAGSGIAYLRMYGFFTKNYYPYTANTLRSVNTSKHVMRDGSDVIIGEYALPNIDLRGLYKLDASNNLYADGDTLESDGTLTRQRGILTVDENSTIELTSSATASGTGFMVRNTGYVYSGGLDYISNRYVAVSPSASISSMKLGEFKIYNDGTQRMVIVDSASTVEALKESLSQNPLVVVHKLATPTTETVTGFTNPQIVDKFGIEEYTDERDFPLPVGHETVYLSELYGDREKLDSLPDRANANGTYAISQTSGKMSLVSTSEISVGDAETVDGYTINTTLIGSASAGTAFTLPKTFSTTDIPNISKKTVVTSASGATAAYANGILTFTNGLFETGDSVVVGTPIAAYTGISSTEIVPNISVETKTVATATRDES